jgi:hypothetical protein
MARLPGMPDLFLGNHPWSDHCRVCGRTLTDPVSKAAGIGPDCAVEQTAARVFKRPHEEETPMEPRCKFSVELTQEVICVIDRLDPVSVTNDAEAVIEWLGENGFDLGLPVIYRDSMGYWDELRVAQGRFAGFVGLGKTITDRDEAVAAIKAKRAVMSGPTMADLGRPA